MTTVIFYKGMMASDSLETHAEMKNGFHTGFHTDVTFTFKDVTKIYEINGHQLGCAGDVRSIRAFLKWYKTQNYIFKPQEKISVIDWDGETLSSWWTEMRSPNFLSDFMSRKLCTKTEKYDTDEEAVFTIGSGDQYVTSAFTKMIFQFDRHNEKIGDHLSKEEVIKYLILLASKHDLFTNDKISIKTFTSVSPQLAKLSKE